MNVLLAPVYESFLAIRENCLLVGGFVVGPMGAATAESLFEFALKNGIKDKDFPFRFTFDPWLAGVIYESQPATGEGGFRYMGLIDEIEINAEKRPYRFLKMKPGEGEHGEEKYDERMPAFVRFRVVERVADVMPGTTHLWPADFGLSESVLRLFMVRHVRKTVIREAFEKMRLTAFGAQAPSGQRTHD